MTDNGIPPEEKIVPSAANDDEASSEPIHKLPRKHCSGRKVIFVILGVMVAAILLMVAAKLYFHNPPIQREGVILIRISPVGERDAEAIPPIPKGEKLDEVLRMICSSTRKRQRVKAWISWRLTIEYDSGETQFVDVMGKGTLLRIDGIYYDVNGNLCDLIRKDAKNDE